MSYVPDNYSYTFRYSGLTTSLQVDFVGGAKRFWDGNGPYADNNVAGGRGTWAAGRPNWADADGAGQRRWGGTTAVFGGSAGIVSVVGAQAFAELQFTTAGYALVAGADGSLTPDGAAIIRTDTTTGVTTLDLPVTGPDALALYWDAGDGIGNGVISGGSGRWTADATNWTGAAPSAINTNWQPGSIGVFTGTAGTVDIRLAPAILTTQGAVPLTGNNAAVAGTFDRAVASGYNPQPLFALYTQGPGLADALGQLSGELHTAERRTLLEDSRVVRETAFDRLNAGLLSIAGQAVTTENGDAATSMWLRAAGSWGTAGADTVGSRFTTEQRGVLTGVDHARGGFTAGAMFYHIRTDVAYASLGASRVESTGGAICGGYRQPDRGIALGVGGAIAGNSAKGSRAITAPGLGQSLASAVDGRTWQLFGEIAFDLAAADTRIEPFGRIAHARVHSDAFTETGGLAAVGGGAGGNHLTVTTLGLRTAFTMGAAWLKASAKAAKSRPRRSTGTLLRCRQQPAG